MPKKTFTEEQILTILRAVEAGASAVDTCRKFGITETTFYRWKRRYEGMGIAEMRRLRQLEEENKKLKQLVADLVNSLSELEVVGVAFVSVTEALDLTTPAGRAMAAMVAVFAQFEREILKERVKAGIAQAKAKGKPMGRPTTARARQEEARALHAAGVSQVQIARQLGISRTSVGRLLKASAASG